MALPLALAGCRGTPQTSEAPRAPNRPSVVRVQTAPVQTISVQRQVDIVGTMMSPDQAKISSEVAGVVREILVELGQEVKAGQVLVRLEPQELNLALERAESALRQTEAQLEVDHSRGGQPPPDEEIASVRTALATRDDVRAALARATRLVSQGLLPQVELENVQTRSKVAEAACQAALDNVRSLKASLQDRRAAYQLAQKKVDDASIRTPVAGSIAERLVQLGEFIRENTPVVTVVQMNPLKLKTAVQERYADLIRPGLPVKFAVESFPGAEFTGRVAYISPSIDQTSRTFGVEILVDNGDRRLKPGFFAKGVAHTRRDDTVLAVTEDAVSTLAGASNVFVIENGKVRRQPVTPGVHQEGVVEIVEGLKGDEVVAVSNLSQLSNGLAVETGSEPGNGGEGRPNGESAPPGPGAGPGYQPGKRGNGDTGERP